MKLPPPLEFRCACHACSSALMGSKGRPSKTRTCARATMSYCCARMSTSLPLPSSPHCVPSTTATCASSRSSTSAAAVHASLSARCAGAGALLRTARHRRSGCRLLQRGAGKPHVGAGLLEPAMGCRPCTCAHNNGTRSELLTHLAWLCSRITGQLQSIDKHAAHISPCRASIPSDRHPGDGSYCCFSPRFSLFNLAS